MTVKYFYGRKEHSTTYAAASFLMPGAAARVEAIRVKKRKSKHASPPPPAPETAPAAHLVKTPSEAPTSEAEVSKEQQAESPVVDTSLLTNSEEDHKSRVAIETESAIDTSTIPVVAKAPNLPKQHEETEAAVAPVESAQGTLDKPSLPVVTEATISTTVSHENSDKTTNCSPVSAPEVHRVEQSIQADESILVHGEGESEPHAGADTDHEQVETVESTSVNDPAPEADHSADDEEDIKSTSTSSKESEPAEESVNAGETVHDQDEKQAPSPAEDLPPETGTVTATPTESPAVDSRVSTDNKSATESPDPAPSSSTVDNETDSLPTSRPALDINPENSEKSSNNNSPSPPSPSRPPSPSTPSSPSRHTSITTSEVEWIKRPEFD